MIVKKIGKFQDKRDVSELNSTAEEVGVFLFFLMVAV